MLLLIIDDGLDRSIDVDCASVSFVFAFYLVQYRVDVFDSMRLGNFGGVIYIRIAR